MQKALLDFLINLIEQHPDQVVALIEKIIEAFAAKHAAPPAQ